MSTLILRTTARYLSPVILIIAIYYLLRGHDAPGGGFIGALCAGAVVVVQYLAFGIRGVERTFPFGFDKLLGAGLFVAVSVGMAGLLFGGSFLEGALFELSVPVFGQIKLALSLAFDVGVFLVVLSVVVAIIRHLGEDET